MGVLVDPAIRRAIERSAIQGDSDVVAATASDLRFGAAL
jgi:hypothetical protein